MACASRGTQDTCSAQPDHEKREPRKRGYPNMGRALLHCTNLKMTHAPTPDTDFIYQTLDSSRREIRLVRLFPRGISAAAQPDIECEVFHADLDEGPKYEALSYAWGNTSKPFKISANGKMLPVTSSLYLALQYLRADLVLPKTFWIDLICIDQTSTQERNHQVAIMRSIFAQAARTTVWLGELSFAPMCGICPFFTIIEDSSEQRSTHFPDLAGWALGGAWEDQLYTNMQTILGSSWFTRIWVVQELACSNNVMVRVADAEATWKSLVTFTKRYCEERQFTQVEDGVNVSVRTLPADGNVITIFDDQRQAYQDGQLYDLLYLVLDLADLKATDELDKIYALAGMAVCQQSDQQFRPDYAATRTESYARLAKHHMSLHPHLERLVLRVIEADNHRLQDTVSSHSSLWAGRYEFTWPVLMSPDHSAEKDIRRVIAYFVGSCHSPLGDLYLVYHASTTSYMILLSAYASGPSNPRLHILDAFLASQRQNTKFQNALLQVQSEKENPTDLWGRMEPHHKCPIWTNILFPAMFPVQFPGGPESGPGQARLWHFLVYSHSWRISVPSSRPQVLLGMAERQSLRDRYPYV